MAGVIDAAERLAAGDHHAKVPVVDKGEAGRLSMALGVIHEHWEDADLNLVESQNDFRKMSTALNVSAATLHEQAEKIHSASGELASGAAKSASSVEEISASVNDINGRVRSNSENASKASALASQTQSVAHQGQGSVQQVVGAILEVRTAGDQVKKVVKLIDDIAFQTNLLALNAAVESARAGVHGKGFAVVANEVRQLANRSANAAKETGTLVEGIVAKVNRTSELAEGTTRNLAEIVDGAVKVTTLMGSVAEASREQASAIDQLAAGLRMIEQVTIQNSQHSDITSRVSESMLGEASNLRELVSADGTVFIRWNDTYSIGVRSMDDQHKRLVELINQLHNAMCHGLDKSAIGAVLTELVNYTVQHFADEERLFEGHGYPESASHKKLHHALVSKVGALKGDFDAGRPVNTDDMMTFLKQWLIVHIKKHDRKYAKHLNAKGVR